VSSPRRGRASAASGQPRRAEDSPPYLEVHGHGLMVSGSVESRISHPVIPTNHPARRRLPKSNAGFLNLEAVVAISILALVMLPLAYSSFHEAKTVCAATYRDAVAMEILDGENGSARGRRMAELSRGAP